MSRAATRNVSKKTTLCTPCSHGFSRGGRNRFSCLTAQPKGANPGYLQPGAGFQEALSAQAALLAPCALCPVPVQQKAHLVRGGLARFFQTLAPALPAGDQAQ